MSGPVVTVTQADIDCAEAVWKQSLNWASTKDMALTIARHRIASTASLQSELAEARAEVERLREALIWYADQFCEGWCEGKDPKACAGIGAENCSGCPAVVTLAGKETP
jgi:hypothetical protein